MDIGSKAKNLFNELIDIPFSLLCLLEILNESKRDYQNNTMKPLTNDLMKPIPPLEPFLGIGGKSPHIDMRDYTYSPRYCSPNDKPEFSYEFLSE